MSLLKECVLYKYDVEQTHCFMVSNIQEFFSMYIFFKLISNDSTNLCMKRLDGHFFFKYSMDILIFYICKLSYTLIWNTVFHMMKRMKCDMGSFTGDINADEFQDRPQMNTSILLGEYIFKKNDR